MGSQDIDALIGLLDPDATAIADGGGLAVTFLRPIEGGEQIARAWIEIANRAHTNVTFLERTVNGQPGLVALQDGVTVTVFAFEVAGDRIKHIWAVRNPEKLRPWTTGWTSGCHRVRPTARHGRSHSRIHLRVTPRTHWSQGRLGRPP